MVAGRVMAVDWSRQGVFSNTNEDVTRQLTGEISLSYGRSEPRATAGTSLGKMDFSLLNVSRKFSPENTASPIAGKVLPGTVAQYTVTDPATAATTKLFTGPLSDIEIDSTSPSKTFSATALDGWGSPGSQQLSTPVYAGQRTGALINVVLDAAGWTGPRDIDPGVTVVDWWWEEGNDASTAVQHLVDSEGPPAIAYVAAGVFVFRDRHHRLLDAQSATSQGLYTQRVPAGVVNAGDNKILRDSFVYDHGLKNIFNSVTLEVDQRQPSDITVVWSTDELISLGSNEVRAYVVQATDPFVNAIVPVPQGPGVVSDTLTGDYVLLVGAVTVTLSRDSGLACILTLTAGGGGALVQGMRLRATPLPVARTVQIVQEDAASVATFTRQKWDGEAPWANQYDALAVAQRIVAVYSQPRPSVTFSVANANAAHLTAILTRKISDRITVRNDELGLNADFFVESITHTIVKNGLIHTLTLGCQQVDPVQPTNVFTFDTAGKGFNDGFFGIDAVSAPSSMFILDTATSTQMFDQGMFAS